MNKLTRKLTIAGFLMIGAVGFLAYAGAAQGWTYYVPVEQYLKDTSLQAKRVRLMGTVLADGLLLDRAGMKASFTLESKGATVPVTYHGSIPDLLKGDVKVVCEGKLGTAGVFEADVLLTKCASKYDAKHKALDAAKQTEPVKVTLAR
jgi:cytochrome c-type biogenesis protein CcmE